jgi:glyoxylase-like metal-dependent hydrolase (beta-lactamase superfamily II)
MIEEVFPRIFKMEIPIPESPLRATNSYVVASDDRFLIVDTGMNRKDCAESIRSSLGELQVDLNRTDFFITHSHSDHVGLVPELKKGASKVYFNRPDAAVLRDPNHWEKLAAFAAVNGFPETEAAIQRHPGRKYLYRGPLDFDLLREGDEIRFGGYLFRCLETPGHTRGHMCLYEPEAKILFSGDHLLEEITPNISRWSENADPLGEFLKSLDKIGHYDIKVVLPGHRNVFSHMRQRIEELLRHHEARNREILSVLKKGVQSAYEVASQVTWDIDLDLWEDFPVPQKWFATGETLSHLQYLERRGEVKREWKEGKAFYCLRSALSK